MRMETGPIKGRGLVLLVLWSVCCRSDGSVCPLSVWSGLHHPTHVESLDGGSLLASEQPGRILHLLSGRSSVVLDLRARVLTTDAPYEERGLLSFSLNQARQPAFLYVSYCARPTASDHDHLLVVSRFNITKDTDGRIMGNGSSERQILSVVQPGRRRNGGYIFFGPPDATLLYVSLGSGGAPDEDRIRFDTGSLLGKVLRLNVSDPGVAYTIPEGNPFAGSGLGFRPEIFAIGFWNPWRCSVDPKQGIRPARVFCGDVGSGPNNTDLVLKVLPGGVYGCPPDCNKTIPGTNGSLPALYAHKHEKGQALIGGPVYRGTSLPQLQGAYLFGDFVHGSLHALWEGKAAGEPWTKTDIELEQTIPGDFYILSLDVDYKGEPLLMVASNLNSSWPSGSIYTLQEKCPDSAHSLSGSAPLLLSSALFLFYFLYCVRNRQQ